MNKTIGNKIHTLRKEKGWPLEELALKLHISKSALQRMEKGETNAWSDHIIKLSDVFQIDFGALMSQKIVAQKKQ